MIQILLILFTFNLCAATPPVLHQGRFRPYEVQESDNPLMVPSKTQGVWLPLSTLETLENNTLYPDTLYSQLHEAYLSQNQTELHQLLLEGYTQIAGTLYQEAFGKALAYPTMGQLNAESLYHRYPLTWITLIAYALAMLILLLGLRRLGFWILLLAFSLHTLILALRCYILLRPPVSNMFETVIYVPWIAVLASLFLKSRIMYLASSLTAICLLTILTQLDSGMENVQAVLDSQLWLTIHVLMVVGSYGLFILAGVLGHIYLFRTFFYLVETKSMRKIAHLMLQAIYIGTVLLISGTILGGVWAAQSWGRFWDWDPKESWAFVSSCTYLIFIHLYRFRHITNFGLAMGSILGLISISFTWYGVNYILGTGLHSYGFGSGGTLYYLSFLGAEALFLIAAGLRKHKFSIER